jgi:hypothetical protein
VAGRLVAIAKVRQFCYKNTTTLLRTFMAKKRLPKLEVSTAGSMRFIEVPSKEAVALSQYLRSHGLHVSPPGPCSAGVDTVQLNGNVATDVIQRLLDKRP